MASSGQTNNFGLNQWLGTDKPTRLDYNSDNLKIDAALAMIRASVTNLNILGVYVDYTEFTTARPTGSVGDYYAVLGETETTIYTWDSGASDWVAVGKLSYTLTAYDEWIQRCEDKADAAQEKADDAASAAETAQSMADDASAAAETALTENLKGWVSLNGTVTFNSADDPIGIINVPADHGLTEGARLRLDNNGQTIDGIVVAYTSTTATFLHKINPENSHAVNLLATGDITNVYYSRSKVPQGFSVDPAYWTVKAVDSTQRSQATTNTNAYNLGGLSIAIPIGRWRIGFSVLAQLGISGDIGGARYMTVSLSTANNTIVDAYAVGFAGAVLELMRVPLCKYIDLSLTSKTTFYLNSRNDGGGSLTMFNLNSTSPAVIEAVCAYL